MENVFTDIAAPSYRTLESIGKGVGAASGNVCGRMDGGVGDGGRALTGMAFEACGVDTDTGELMW